MKSVSKMPGLMVRCIKRHCISSNHTHHPAAPGPRLLYAASRARCWRSCPGLRRRGRRRSGCRGSRCDWCTGTRSGSSWCTAPRPRCGRRRCRRTGSPRAGQRGYQRWPTECGNTSIWRRWRWCSWASTLRPGCVSHQALLWCPQTPPDGEFKRGSDYYEQQPNLPGWQERF